MAVATVAADEEVRSEDHNALAGLLNGTADYGEPVKFYQHNDASVFSLTAGNQDTTNGLIALFQYGTVGAATEVARITKAGILGVLADKGGWTFSLDAYSTSTLNAATTSSTITAWNAAWTAAFNAITAAGGGTITLRSGTYLAATSTVTNWPSNCIIRGAGVDATTILHPGYTQAGSTNREPILFFGLTDCGVADLTIDGNRTNNNGTSTGFDSVEVSIDGTRCWAFNIKVDNFNKNGVGMSGTENSVIDCYIGLSSPPSSYTALGAGGSDSNDYGAIYGIQTGGGVTERRLLISGTKVYGTRSAGIFIGGAGLTITDCHVYDCHRGDFPDNIGGGQIAIAPTNGVNRSTFITIANCQVGPITRDNSIAGTGITTGIEINGCDYVNVSDCNIDGSQAGGGSSFNVGIALDQGAYNVSVTGGTIYGCVKGLYLGNASSLPVKKFGITNVNFEDNAIAIYPTTTIDEFSLTNCRFSGSTTLNWNAGTAPATSNWQSYGHVIVDGDNVPTRLYKSAATEYVQSFIQGSATGYGLRVSVAGSTASQVVFAAVGGSGVALQVFANGQINNGGNANGQVMHIKTLTELTTIAAAATTDTSIQFPAGSLGLGVTVRVTTVIPTAATFDVGIAGATTRYGSGIAVAANTTNTSPGTTNPSIYAAATSVRITPNMTPGDATGRLRVTLHYIDFTAPTS